MPDPTSRLSEARKQLQMVADEIEDEAVLEDLQRAEDLISSAKERIDD